MPLRDSACKSASWMYSIYLTGLRGARALQGEVTELCLCRVDFADDSCFALLLVRNIAYNKGRGSEAYTKLFMVLTFTCRSGIIFQA